MDATLLVRYTLPFSKLSPEEFVKVSGSLLIVYGLGNMAGPLAGGRVMQTFGAGGLFMSMGAGFAAYALYALWRSFRRPALAPEARTDFQTIALTRQQTPETFQLDPRVEEGSEAEA